MKKYIGILPMKSWITIPMKNTNEYGQLNPWITIPIKNKNE